jgi:hypothetical protein
MKNKNVGDIFILSVIGLYVDDARAKVLEFVKGASETSYEIKFVRRGWLYTLDIEDGKVREAGRCKIVKS